MRIVAGGGGGVSYAAHMSPAEPPDWLNRFPPLRAISDPAWRRIAERLSVMRIEPGTSVFRVGDPCRNYLLVSEGAVRVQTVSESGREIVLYRVGSGEICVLTTSCLFAGAQYPAEGVTETAVQAVAMPKGLFDEAVAASPGFRQFVFASLGERLSRLMALVQEVAFGRIDARLAQRLLLLASADGAVGATHQDLATELGTAREVVSRLLKDFERRAWVRLARGRIEIADRAALERLTVT